MNYLKKKMKKKENWKMKMMSKTIKLGPLIHRDKFYELKRKNCILVRTSQVGRCWKQFFYSAVGVPQEEPDLKTKKLWEDRSKDEVTIIKNLLKQGYKIRDFGDQQKTYLRSLEFKDDKDKFFPTILQSTPDGMIFDNEIKEWVPLEVKSLNPFKFDHLAARGITELSREHTVQIQGEMISTGKPRAIVVIGNSKLKTVNPLVFKVDCDPQWLNWMEDRIEFVVRIASNNKKYNLIPEYYPGSQKCRWCLYTERCKASFNESILRDLKTSKLKGELDLREDFIEFNKLDDSVKSLRREAEFINDSIQSMYEKIYELVALFIKTGARTIMFRKDKVSIDEFLSMLNRFQLKNDERRLE